MRLWTLADRTAQDFSEHSSLQAVGDDRNLAWQPQPGLALPESPLVLASERLRMSDTALWQCDTNDILHLSTTPVGRTHLRHENQLPTHDARLGITTTNLDHWPNYLRYNTENYQSLGSWWLNHDGQDQQEAVCIAITEAVAAWHAQEQAHGNLNAETIWLRRTKNVIDVALLAPLPTATFEDDSQQLQALCECVWRSNSQTLAANHDPSYQHQSEHAAALASKPTSSHEWLQTSTICPSSDRLSLDGGSNGSGILAATIVTVLVILSVLIGVVISKTEDAERQRERAETWSEHLADATVREVADAGNTHLALQLATRLQQELDRNDDQQRRVLIATWIHLAQLTADRFSWQEHQQALHHLQQLNQQ